MQPYHPNPSRPPTLPLRTQRASIERLKKIPQNIRGWLLVGPGGTCKTSYVAAWITDAITLRIAEHGAYEPCVWYASAQDWLKSKQAWDNRDFNDNEISEPELSAKVIREACEYRGHRPILWIEELDKVKMTDDRRDLLHELLDCVYRLRGLIITTSNLTVDQLTEKLGYPMIRRIDGRDDDPSEFITCDFFKELKNSKSRV